jgi:hypothetical protein
MLSRPPTLSASAKQQQGGLHAGLQSHINRAAQSTSRCRTAPHIQAFSKPTESTADSDAVLSWSFTETATADAGSQQGSSAPKLPARPDQPGAKQHFNHHHHHHHQQQQQQQKVPLPQEHQKQRRQQQQQTKHQQAGARANSAAAFDTNLEHPAAPGASSTLRPQTRQQQQRNHRQQGAALQQAGANSYPGPHSSSSRQYSADADGYKEAQQRVRAILAAADPNNAAAAAEQIADTINDLTIALQLLATAPRPTNLAAYRKFETAAQQLATAVLQKYKQLLLRPQPQAQHRDMLPSGSTQQQQQLGAALASLPATKIAAAAFSLGVLRLYDRDLAQALEAASLQLVQQGAFKPNQLGQLVQGFVYLDHQLSPDWHIGLLKATKRHLSSMQAPQLASLAVWLLQYGLCSSSSSSSSSSGAGLGSGVVGATWQQGLPLSGAAAAAAGVASGRAAGVRPNATWVQQYCAAVGQNARSFKPLQLVQVLQATAALYQQQQRRQQQQQQQQQEGAWDGSVQGPTQGAQGTEAYSSNSSSNGGGGTASAGTSLQAGADADMGGRDWVLQLEAAVQQQLPELTMAHLAAALPALLLLTGHEWPQQQLQPLLLQVKLLLSGCAGRDLVVVLQAVGQLGGPGTLAAQQEWCDAVLVQLHAQLPSLGPGELAVVVNAISLLKVKPYKAWVYALCERLRVDTRAMDSGQVLMVLEGLAAVGIQLDPEVLHVFVLQIRRWMGSWGGDELERVVQALRGMYPKVLPGRTVHQLVDELKRRRQFLALQERQQSQLIGPH